MPCTACGPEDPCEDLLLLDAAINCILCGHGPSDHVQKIAPMLPPKGPCPSTNCTGFLAPPSELVTAHTRCIQQVEQGRACSQTYKAHKNLNQPDASAVTTAEPASSISGSTGTLPAASLSSSQRGTQRVIPWEPPAQSVARNSNLTTHQRMVSSYNHARAATAMASATSARVGSATLNPLGDKGKLAPRASRQPFHKPVKVKTSPAVQLYIFAETFAFTQDSVEHLRPFIRPIRHGSFRVPDLHMKTVLQRHNDANLSVAVQLPGDSDDNVHTFICNILNDHLRNNSIIRSTNNMDWDEVWGNLVGRRNNRNGAVVRQFSAHVPARGEGSLYWTRALLFTHAKQVGRALGLNGPSMILAPREGYLIVNGHHCYGPKLFHGLITHHERVSHDNDPLHDESSTELARLAITCFPECSSTRSHPLHYDYPPDLPVDTTWRDVAQHAFQNATAEDDADDVMILRGLGGPTSMAIPSSVVAPSTSSFQAHRSSPTAACSALATPFSLDDALDSDDESLARVLQESRRTNEEHLRTVAASHDTPGASTSTSSSAAMPQTNTGRRARSPHTPPARAVRPRITFANPDTSPEPLTPSVETAHSGLNPRSPREMLSYIELKAPTIFTFNDPGPEAVRIKCHALTGPDAQYKTEDLNSLAQTYYEHVIKSMGGPRPVTVFQDVSVEIPESPEAFLAPPYVRLHEGCGSSVPLAFMSSVMNVVLKDSLWFKVTDTLQVLSTKEVLTFSSPARLRAAGRLFAQYFATNKALPIGLSPAFFEALVHGEQAVDDAGWLAHFHDSAAQLITSWGSDLASPIDFNDTNNYTAAEVFGETVTHMNAMDVHQRQAIRRQLVAYTVLGIPIGVHTFDDHPTVSAFKKGFDIVIPNSQGQTLCSLFGRNSKPILLSLSNMFPKSGEELQEKDLIHWVSSNSSALLPYEARWKELFWIYLKGSGHVEHPELDEIFPENERKVVRHDKGLRVRAFLQATTGSETLPRNPVQITFVSRSTTQENGESIYSNIILEVRACMTLVKAYIGPAMKQLLDRFPEADRIKVFEVALHTVLAGPGANSFQMA